MKLDVARMEAAARVDRVKDDPQGQLALRQGFYERHTHGEDAALGKTELVFQRWLIARGVLDPLPKGSPFWRAVNADLCVNAETARILFEARSNRGITDPPVRKWLAFLRKPSVETWHNAFCTSFMGAALAHRALLARESAAEQLFIEAVQARLLGDLLRSRTETPPSELPVFWPRSSPITEEQLQRVLREGHGVDAGPIPGFGELRAEAATILNMPALAPGA